LNKALRKTLDQALARAARQLPDQAGPICPVPQGLDEEEASAYLPPAPHYTIILPSYFPVWIDGPEGKECRVGALAAAGIALYSAAPFSHEAPISADEIPGPEATYPVRTTIQRVEAGSAARDILPGD
jgi:hypothetical protein